MAFLAGEGVAGLSRKRPAVSRMAATASPAVRRYRRPEKHIAFTHEAIIGLA